MNDNVNNNNSQGQGGFDPNRPRFKKVKRPIRRDASGAPIHNSPMPPRAQDFSEIENIIEPAVTIEEPVIEPVKEVENFDLDSYLDEPAPAQNNLPTTVREEFKEEAPQFIDDQDLEEDIPQSGFIVNGMFTKKAVGIIVLAVFIIGILFSKLFFSEETVVRDGLQGVVINAEVPRGRARCGIAERTQGCVIYIMNPQRQELNARDFYDLAAQLTGRQRFLIETGNMRYSSVRIRPGEIAQLNIPPL